MKDTYREQLVVRLTKAQRRELSEVGRRFSMRISDFSRVALFEGLAQIKERGAIRPTMKTAISEAE